MVFRFVKIIVAILASILADRAIANEWYLYGSVRMATFYVDEENVESGTLTEDNRTICELQGNSRIGAIVKGDTMDARAEFGVGTDRLITRLLYGVWNFSDSWRLKIGQDYTPILYNLSNQVFNNDQHLWQIGNAYVSTETVQRIMRIVNPMASIIASYRDILYWGSRPGIDFFLRTAATAAAFLVIGYLIFHHFSPVFGEEV